MPECTVCGGDEFTPHDGFYYCVECQTQSQDLRQLEFSYRVNASYSCVQSRKKSRKRGKKKKYDTLGGGPVWTSWQAFNYVLKGMTDELIALGAPENFERVVLQLWACLLKVNEVAFTSRFKERPPKLGYPFKYRDGKVLYDVDARSTYSRKQKERGWKRKKRSVSSASTSGARSLKKKMQKSDYEQLSSTMPSSTADDANTTLESLGESSKDSDYESDKLKVPRREHFSKEGYRRRVRTGGRLRSDLLLGGVTKQTLFTLLYVALRMTHSEIQLSDMFRFMREGHLSFMGVTHFLPEELKLGLGDIEYLNTRADSDMPTHLRTRQLTYTFCRKLRIRTLPAPDLSLLLKRYVSDLLLPDGFAELAGVLLSASPQPEAIRIICWSKPSFELMALAPLLVLFKLLLGMDGLTERHSSHFARVVNRLQGSSRVRLFSWLDWQWAIECRRAVLSVWHYPTRELTDPHAVFDAHTTAQFLQNTHRDPLLRQRRYLGTNPSPGDAKIEDEVKDTLESIPTPPRSSLPIFHSTLTPGVSYIQDLLTWLKGTGQPEPPWVNVLCRDWSSDDVQYLLNVEQYIPLLEQHGVSVKQLPPDWLTKHMYRVTWVHDKLNWLSEAQQSKKYTAVLRTDKSLYKSNSRRHYDPRLVQQPAEREVTKRCDNKYWRLTPSPTAPMWTPVEFEEEVMPKFPSSWAWLLTQCANMLHVYTRDVYFQVLELEETLLNQTVTTL